MLADISALLWTAIISILTFWKVDVDTRIYLVVVILLWFVVLSNISCNKNTEFYQKVTAMFATNFGAFVFSKYLHGYHFLFDLEDKVCIIYFLGMTILGICTWYKLERTERKTEPEKELFQERLFDKERLQEYLHKFSVVGINGSWGSGKSFVTDRISEENYIPVKIDLMSCNLDEIQMKLLAELDKALKHEGIFSAYSPKVRKQLEKESFVNQLGSLLVQDNVTYSEAISGFKEDLKKLGNKVILVIYEDLDRINDVDTIKKILSISEKIAGGNIKIVYQYDEENLKEKGFDKRFLEKYIPFTMNLTEISFSHILKYLMAQDEYRDFVIKYEDFRFLKMPIYPLYLSRKSYSQYGTLQLEIPNVTIRKVEHFLNELCLFLEKDTIYEENKREVILFFLIKHFYDDIYQKLLPGKSLLDIFTFEYDGKENTLVYWFQYCKVKEIDITEVFNSEENSLSALMLSLFSYKCRIEEVGNGLENIVNESESNIEYQNANEQKDRIIWNLLCNGKSEYTNQQVIIRYLQKSVLSKPKEEQKEAFQIFWNNIFNGRYEEYGKSDTDSIFLFGVPSMISLFQANLVAGISSEQWIDFVEFYLYYDDVRVIAPELIECLNYCELKNKKLYLYLLKQFNKLEIQGNMNSHQAYKTFLKKYSRALSKFGYIHTYGVKEAIDESEELNIEWVLKAVWNRMETDLLKLKETVRVPSIKEDIDIILAFLDKNKQLMLSPNQFERPKTKVSTSMQSRYHNQTVMDELNQSELGEEEFEERIAELYREDKITAYEVARLERYR